MRLRRTRRDQERDDTGMTLVELIVAMGIFTVVIAVFMAGIVVMTKNTARAQAVADAGDEVRRVFQRLDREVRYASAINRPGTGSSGAYYVEYLVSAVEAGKQPMCTQWRYVPATGTIERRTWANVTSGASPSAWSTLANRVRNDLATQKPFEFTPAGSINASQQLRVFLDVGPGAGGPDARKGAQLDSQFVARNTDTSTTTNADIDNNGASDTPVCQQSGTGRP
ncbi:type II secretion system protein [Sanguibacter sp. 25GB23B1]|uniref:type II secretion system protein n=1 Tax=unclassified Sanguibacter TaxID=2645534 RepID=UPI0032AFDDBA